MGRTGAVMRAAAPVPEGVNSVDGELPDCVRTTPPTMRSQRMRYQRFTAGYVPVPVFTTLVSAVAAGKPERRSVVPSMTCSRLTGESYATNNLLFATQKFTSVGGTLSN